MYCTIDFSKKKRFVLRVYWFIKFTLAFSDARYTLRYTEKKKVLSESGKEEEPLSVGDGCMTRCVEQGDGRPGLGQCMQSASQGQQA